MATVIRLDHRRAPKNRPSAATPSDDTAYLYELTARSGGGRFARFLRHRIWQKLTRGWADTDTWNLDQVCSRWALPRLRRFRELSPAIPEGITAEKWARVLGDMIYFHEVTSEGRPSETDGTPAYDVSRYERGRQFWGLHYTDLWW